MTRVTVVNDATLTLTTRKTMMVIQIGAKFLKEKNFEGTKKVIWIKPKLPFCTIYLFEKAFSGMTQIKTKHRGCLQSVDSDLRVCLSTAVQASIDKMSHSFQSFPSH